MQDPLSIEVMGSDLGRGWRLKGTDWLLREGGISGALENELKVLERTVRVEKRV